MVDPTRGLMQPELSYRAYEELAKAGASVRPLRIALLTQNPANYSSRRLIEAATARAAGITPAAGAAVEGAR